MKMLILCCAAFLVGELENHLFLGGKKITQKT